MSSGIGSRSRQDASEPAALASVPTEADVAPWSVASADVAAWSVAVSDSWVDGASWCNVLTTVAGADAGAASSGKPSGALPWTITAGAEATEVGGATAKIKAPRGRTDAARDSSGSPVGQQCLGGLG